MTKNISALRLLSAILLFALSLAMSCTDDHVVPEPVPNCNRLNGQSRAFPCEFEIEKLEFMSGSSNTAVAATLTPTDSLFAPGKEYSWQKTGTEDFLYRYKVQLTYKRIAEPPKGQENQYALYMTVGGIDTEDFLDWSADINTANMAVGETRSQFYIIDYHLNPWTPISLRMRLFSIVNLETYKKLQKTPYDYTAVRDRAESWIRFKAK
ncbi:hypothetical protein SAMN04487996_1264 [Dyadobacter soli]|uniref:DUF4377 domain-containing protein n=1 Tax=Dyadobacter soli TaxID=659014 RepID=A0A1G7YEZ4_9BACT|nr:hypothetical protein [Dyadobacter soli]SDG94897.1 hypothetical protein SAMN04487996_1264 [Dyadobacter soli]